MRSFENQLHQADCKDLLMDMHFKGETNLFDLIYIDPPFNSDRNYNVIFSDKNLSDSKIIEEVFQDIWSNVSYLDELDTISAISPVLHNFLKMLETTGLSKSALSYLTYMAIRCWFMRELLKDTGSFYYHCDPTMSHYIKIMLDYIFGASNFRNEIVWKRDSVGRGAKKTSHQWSREIDIILFYTKTKHNQFNQLYTNNLEYTQLKEFRYKEKNGRQYKIVTLGDYSQSSIETMRKNGLIHTTKYGTIYKKYYLDEFKLAIGSIWVDIPNLSHGKNKENLRYPTQKPEKLIERIILASSNPGDIVGDFFMGGATTLAVCVKLDRKFLGCDINHRAIQIAQKRLEDLGLVLRKDFYIYGIPHSAEELRNLVDSNIIGKGKNSKFELEEVTVKYYLKHNMPRGITVVGNEKKVGDNSIDGYFKFNYNDKIHSGLVQITSGAGKNHMKAFCSEIAKGTGDIGLYITFENKITAGMRREAKLYGKFSSIDKIRIISFEDLIDKKMPIEIPQGIVTI